MKRALLYLLPLGFLFLMANTFTPATDTLIPSGSENLFTQDTFDMEQALAEIRETIKGREKDPAEEVFKDIQILKGMPAGKVLAIMKVAFSNSLGVNCTHCHDPAAWESEAKPTKQITREMWQMVGKINRELLSEIPNLQSENAVINCTTCHRGQVKPALSLDK